MTANFDVLIERLTKRFAADPELRMEIGQELRTHLEECAAEFAAGGMSSDDAKAAAAKALGDEGEIADKLWQANRRRVRLRKAARWAFGVTAGPVAAVAVIGVGWSSLVSICVLFVVLSLGAPGPDNVLFQHARANLINSIPPESRFIFDRPAQAPDRIQWASTLVSQHPNDPVFAANYVDELLFGGKISDHAPQILDVCRHGSEIEPDNAFFHLISAAVLLDGSTTYVKPSDPPAAARSFNWESNWNPMPKDRQQTFSIDRWTVNDPAKYQQGLAEFHRAAQCPYLDSHIGDMLQRRLDQLSPATRLSDHLLRVMAEFSAILPQLNSYREAVNIACSAALDAADQKQRDAALGLVVDARRIGDIDVARSHLIVELLVGIGLRGEAIGTEALVGRSLELPGRFEATRDQYATQERQMADLRSRNNPELGRELKLEGDFLTSAYAPPVTRVSAEQLAPGRVAEYAVFDRTMVAALTLVFLLIAGGKFIPALLPRHKPMLFMGWRRLAAATLVAILPVAIYAIYTLVIPISGRTYGVRVSPDRLLVEYVIVAVGVRMLISAMSGRALRDRAAELGVEYSAPRRGRWLTAVDLIAAAVVVAYLTIWHYLAGRMAPDSDMPTGGIGLVLVPLLLIYGLSDRDELRWYGVILVALLALGTLLLLIGPVSYLVGVYAVIFISVVGGMVALAIYRFVRGVRSQVGGAFNRGMSEAPLFVTTALAMLCVFGPLLRWQERSAVAQMSRPGGSYSFQHEIELSPWHDLQQRVMAEAAAP